TSEEPAIAYLGGKMKFNRIRVLVGDKVEVLIDPYGGKGRIVKRF
ncbi:MAG: translation initiation factor IF-1, partial [Candidatus Pacebacteria bacterium]|nr:translation initiation factor IF-1 [Candidatus Paceibacterota bacterium]